VHSQTANFHIVRLEWVTGQIQKTLIWGTQYFHQDSSSENALFRQLAANA
jgi:hypothetical protein